MRLANAQLENAMERAVALATSRRVNLGDLPEEVRRALPAPVLGEVRTLASLDLEYALAERALNHGNRAKTAAHLGIGASTLYRMLRRAPALPIGG